MAPTYSESIVVSFRPSDGTGGMIAAAMSTAAMKVALTPFVKRMGICPGNATYDQVVDTLTQSADLVLGAPQLQDTQRDCDAVSLGMGFVAAPTPAPTKRTPPPPPGPDDCGG